MLALQIIALVLVLIVSSFFKDSDYLCSVFLGGVCSFVPNMVFALYFFRYQGAGDAKKTLGCIYLAEAIKFILILVMLIFVYSSLELNAIAVLIGFITTYLSSIFLPLVKNN